MSSAATIAPFWGNVRLIRAAHRRDSTHQFDLADEIFDAVSFEEASHDALFADAGLFIALDRNGRYEPRLERFLLDEPIRTTRGTWRLVIASP